MNRFNSVLDLSTDQFSPNQLLVSAKLAFSCIVPVQSSYPLVASL